MKFFPSAKVFLEIGSVQIRWYAVLILCGIVVAYAFSKYDMKKTRYMDSDDYLDDLIFAILWTGILGARLWYCAFFDLEYYLSNPLAILRIYDGGLAIQGGLIFGLVTAIIVTKKRKTSFLKTLDCVMPNVLIAQAFGRWGNYVNQECHGPAVDESYFDGILSFIKEGMHIGNSYYMPMFFFESSLCVLGFVIIRLILKKYQKKRGELFYSYFMWYGIVRLYIESLRTDSLMIGSFKVAQLISIIFIVFGILGYVGALEKLIPSKGKKPVVIFDFDGTLIDTDPGILLSYEHCFEVFGRPADLSEDWKNEVLGPALREIFPKYWPDHPYEEVYKVYEEYQSSILDKIEPIKNCELVLKTLHEEGYSVGIVSTRIKEGIETRLEKFGLSEYVDDIFGLHEVVNLKPDPEAVFGIIKNNKWFRDDVIYVGDNIADMECGNNYGAYTVGYIQRPSKEEGLRNSCANECITDLKEILNIVNKDIYFTYNNK